MRNAEVLALSEFYTAWVTPVEGAWLRVYCEDVFTTKDTKFGVSLSGTFVSFVIFFENPKYEVRRMR
jgi:hypothetical protein